MTTSSVARAERTGPAGSEILEAARALVPALRARRAEANELRRLPDASVADLRALGILGVAAPVARGGSDLGVDVLLEVAVELGKGCGSTAWCGANWGVHNLLMSMFPRQAQDEVFGDGTQLPIVSTGFSPLRASAHRVPGGSSISGQWDFASGVDHAAWVVLMAITETGPVAHLVPTSDLQIVDTWHTTGLRGSGSKDVAASDLFVPEHRLLGMIEPTEGRSLAAELYGTPFTHIPMSSYFGVGVVGSIVGMALGAVEVFIERTSDNVGGLSGTKVRSRPDIHYKIGESATEADAALSIARSTYAELRSVGAARAAITMNDRLRWRRDQAYAAKLAVEATQRLFQVGGAHVVWSDDQLGQFHNDITTASHHYGMAWSTLFNGYGRLSLGLDHEVAMV